MSVRHWERRVRDAPTDADALSCLGLALLGNQEFSAAARMLVAATKAQPLDYVAHQGLAFAFDEGAKQAVANDLFGADQEKEVAMAYQRAVRHFSRAEDARVARLAAQRQVEGSQLPGSVDTAYPQLGLAQPRNLVLSRWGLALLWLGRADEAAAVFQVGVEEGLWRSRMCRPLPEAPMLLPPDTFFPTVPRRVDSHGNGNVDGEGRGHADADADAVAAVRRLMPLSELEALLPTVRAELDVAMAAEVAQGGDAGAQGGSDGAGDSRSHRGGGEWSPEMQGLHQGRTWSVKLFREHGNRRGACDTMPRTCAALEAVPGVALLRDGTVKLSRMLPGTRVKAHTGPTNVRVRIHCAVTVPSSPSGAPTHIRVGDTWRAWREGECWAFDESCEHEVVVADDADGPRVVLLVDVVNPWLQREQDVRDALLPEVRVGGGTHRRDTVVADYTAARGLLERSALLAGGGGGGGGGGDGRSGGEL